MPTVTAVHIVFDQSNDPGRAIRQHVGREMAKGMMQSDIVQNAWQHRHVPARNAVTTRSSNAPGFNPVELYYDPAVVGGASDQDVLDALRNAG